MIYLRNVILIIHIFSVIFWLGPDVVAFYLSFSARDRTAPPSIRLERFRILKVADGIVRYSWRITIASGLALLAMNPAWLQAGWLRFKLIAAGLIILIVIIMHRVSFTRRVLAVLHDMEAGVPGAAEREDEAWTGQGFLRGLVLSIWVLVTVSVIVAVLKPF